MSKLFININFHDDVLYLELHVSFWSILAQLELKAS